MRVHDLGATGRRFLATALIVGGTLGALPIEAGADEISLRASGLVSTHKYHVALERRTTTRSTSSAWP